MWVRCDSGGEIEVRADNVTLTVTGSCTDIDVEHASGARITAEAVDEVEITGSDNRVIATEVRQIDIEGDRNTVDVDSVGVIDVEGDDNTVTYGRGNPRIGSEGSNNTIRAR